jgi:dTDP-4-dehydrorhamnose reductase
MKILITGGQGQLGKELVKAFLATKEVVVSTTKKQLDITKFEQSHKFIDDFAPHWIINCAAYTNVDSAEQYVHQSNLVNAVGPYNLAKICKLTNSKLIHISTNSVFSSDVPRFFSPNEVPNPINQYSSSKALGEELIVKEHPDNSWIIRTSWLYGEYGGNFVHAILEKIQRGGIIRVVDDQFGQPTNSRNLANYITSFVLQPFNQGIYHYSNVGYASRFDFAAQILLYLGANTDRLQIRNTIEEVGTASRSKYSLLYLDENYSLAEQDFTSWKDSLEYFLREYKRKCKNA